MNRRRRPPDLAGAVAAADERRLALRESLAGRRAELPLRYWRQAAHFTVPAGDSAMARKAVEGGTAPMGRILERFEVRPETLAEHLEVPADAVRSLLEHPEGAPLVMLDGEDATAPGDAAADQAVRAATATLTEADWSGAGPATLRFFRPPGLNLETTARDLYALLWALADRSDPESFPLDGICFPKIEHPEEVDLVHGLLADAERALGLPEGRIRVAYLVESGWAAEQLGEIAQRAAPRLCAIIFGLADYSADLGLPRISNEHPVADWARAEIVNVAGAVGVPAIDGMTLDYPVADAGLDRRANQGRFLDRMALVYRDALRARAFGMSGKWVGHPAQLFAVMLAARLAHDPSTLDLEAAKLEAYRVAEEEGRGATIIGGVMSDRATDRHARAILRQATALGRFDADRARTLGVIDEAELVEARRWVGAGAKR